MKVEGIKEIIDIRKITVNPRHVSDRIKRIGEATFLILITVSGFGVAKHVKRGAVAPLTFDSAHSLDLRHNDEFVIKVDDQCEEPLSVILMQVVTIRTIW